VLIGLVAGYIYALLTGVLTFDAVAASWANAAVFAPPEPFRYGVSFSLAAVIGFCLMAFVSAVETVGDVSGITKGGAGRQATEREIEGATFADGIGTAVAGVFGGLPNTSFSQNVGLIAMTGVMSRHVVTCGAIFLIVCGLIPKVGSVIRTVPIEVLGGGVIVMFGMVVAAGISMLADVDWNKRNMVIFAISISLGLGLQLEPQALQYLPETARILLTSGLLPAAFLAIFLNLLLPAHLEDSSTEEISGGMAGHSRDAAID
jgi:NCS2 family nucleobase:cation symporter-2